MKVGNYPIPFDGKGNQQHYPDPWRGDVDWRENHQFFDELTFDSYSRGRSAAYFGFNRIDGRAVTVFLKEFQAMVPHMVNGKIRGKFSFVKRGQNYGCVLLEAP